MSHTHFRTVIAIFGVKHHMSNGFFGRTPCQERGQSALAILTCYSLTADSRGPIAPRHIFMLLSHSRGPVVPIDQGEDDDGVKRQHLLILPKDNETDEFVAKSWTFTSKTTTSVHQCLLRAENDNVADRPDARGQVWYYMCKKPTPANDICAPLPLTRTMRTSPFLFVSTDMYGPMYYKPTLIKASGKAILYYDDDLFTLN